MKVVGVIPARYAASRFPGKLLASLGGKTVICRVVEAAKQATSLDRLMLATDDQRIADSVKHLGVEVVMTDPGLPSGTDRIFAALGSEAFDIAVNIQGDEPLLDPAHIDVLVKPLLSHSKFDYATLATQISHDQLKNPNRVKLVMDAENRAIYFSRSPIPHSRGVDSLTNCPVSLLHIGLYAYRAESLRLFCHSGPCELERAEGLEQLRMLWLGKSIAVSIVDGHGPGIDTPEDLVEIEKILVEKGKHGVK